MKESEDDISLSCRSLMLSFIHLSDIIFITCFMPGNGLSVEDARINETSKPSSWIRAIMDSCVLRMWK